MSPGRLKKRESLVIDIIHEQHTETNSGIDVLVYIYKMINYWDEYRKSPVFLWRACFNISAKNLVVTSSRNGNASATNMRKFSVNEMTFVCFLIRLLSEQFLHMRSQHPGVPLGGGHSRSRKLK